VASDLDVLQNCSQFTRLIQCVVYSYYGARQHVSVFEMGLHLGILV